MPHHGEQDARAGPDRAQEVGGDGEQADAHAAERRGRRDVPVELLLRERKQKGRGAPDTPPRWEGIATCMPPPPTRPGARLHGLGVVASEGELHVLLAEAAGNVLGRLHRDLDPDLGKEGAGREHEGHVQHEVQRVRERLRLRRGRGRRCWARPCKGSTVLRAWRPVDVQQSRGRALTTEDGGDR